MTPVGKAHRIFNFGPFRLDLSERVLSCDGKAVPLAPKLFDTLELLVENNGHVVEKNDMIERLWQDSFVEDSSLSQNIFQLRKILKAGSSGTDYIETIPKRGYRFTAVVKIAEDEPVRRAETQNTEAYQAFLMGTYFSNKRTKEALARSIDYFHQALVLDPGYAQAYAGIADSYFWLAYGESDDRFRNESFERSRSNAQKAIDLDPTVAEAHAALGTVKIKHDRDPVAADDSFRKAIDADPNCTMAFSRYTYFLAAMGRLNEALEKMTRAQEIDPLSPDLNASVAMVLYMLRDYDQAIRYCHNALAIEPALTEASLLLGRCLEQKGRFKDAASHYKEANTIEGDELSAHLYALTGQRIMAEATLMDLLSPSNSDRVRPYNIAAIYSALGENDLAFEWLEKLFVNWTERLRMLRYDPRLDELRDDPRFGQLIKQAIPGTSENSRGAAANHSRSLNSSGF